MKTNKPWNWMGMVCALCLLLAATAKSDTYNFFFTKPAKKKHKAAVAPVPEAPEEAPAPAPEDDEEEAPPPAPAPKKSAAAPIVVNGAGNGQPVIINNNNNITIPTARVERPAPPVSAPAAPSLLNSEELKVTGTVSESRPRWHFGLGLIHAPTATRLEGSGAETGGQVSLGFDFTHWLGANLYSGGLVYDHGDPETHYYGGLDLEVHPFHVTIGKLDVLELGFLIGGSTMRADWDNWGSLHLGGRATLSFDQQFGITVATRANFGSVVFEGGLVTRF